jgi:ATP-dependent DNA helicase RecG
VLLTPIEIGLLAACVTTSRAIHELLGVAGYTSRTGNFKRSMEKLLQGDLLAMTIPEKPTSRLQKYRLTEKGQALLAELEKPGGKP